MTEGNQPLLPSIRCGKFVAESHDHFALSFQIIRVRDGVPRPVSIHGVMPVLITQWNGSGYVPFLQSLN